MDPTKTDTAALAAAAAATTTLRLQPACLGRDCTTHATFCSLFDNLEQDRFGACVRIGDLSEVLLAKLTANGPGRGWTPVDVGGRGGGVDPQFERAGMPWHGRGQGFESPKLHRKRSSQTVFRESNTAHDHASPSGSASQTAGQRGRVRLAEASVDPPVGSPLSRPYPNPRSLPALVRTSVEAAHRCRFERVTSSVPGLFSIALRAEYLREAAGPDRERCVAVRRSRPDCPRVTRPGRRWATAPGCSLPSAPNSILAAGSVRNCWSARATSRTAARYVTGPDEMITPIG